MSISALADAMGALSNVPGGGQVQNGACAGGYVCAGAITALSGYQRGPRIEEQRLRRTSKFAPAPRTSFLDI